MTNISGAASEAASTADAYQSLGIAAHAKTFVIPVFNNMPSESNTITLGIRGNKKGVANSDVILEKVLQLRMMQLLFYQRIRQLQLQKFLIQTLNME